MNRTTMSILVGKTPDNGIGDHILLTNKSKAGEEEEKAFLTFRSSGDDSDRRSSLHTLEQGKFSTRTSALSTYFRNKPIHVLRSTCNRTVPRGI